METSETPRAGRGCLWAAAILMGVLLLSLALVLTNDPDAIPPEALLLPSLLVLAWPVLVAASLTLALIGALRLLAAARPRDPVSVTKPTPQAGSRGRNRVSRV